MQVSPSHHHLDHRLQEIDQQINSALRDIRRNLQELERVAGGPLPASKSGASRPFAAVLRQTIEVKGDTGG